MGTDPPGPAEPARRAPPLGYAAWMSGGWSPRRVVLLACAALAVAEILFVGALFVSHHHIGQDFAAFYAASFLVQTGHAELLRSPEALVQVAEGMIGQQIGSAYPWPYPPMARLLAYPLAFLPIAWAYAVAMAAGVAGYLSAVRRIVGPRADATLMALVFPAVAVTLLYGQITFVSAALLGWGLALLPRRPRLAGALLGLLAFKPQFGLLVPVALVAGRRWPAALAAAASALAFAAAGTAAFGWQAWEDFFRSAEAFGAFLGERAPTMYTYQSVFGAVRLAGGGVALAWIAQAVAAAAAAGAVWRAWSGRSTDEVRSATLVAATLLASPHLCDYDLVLLAIPLAFLVRDAAVRTGRSPGAMTFVAAGLVPPLARSTSRALHVAPGPWLTLLLWWTCLRARRETAAGPAAVLHGLSSLQDAPELEGRVDAPQPAPAPRPPPLA